MRILTLDIETAPAKAYVWGLFKENIPLDRLIEPGRIICWAAKWDDQKQVMFGAEWGPSFIEDLHELLDEADVVVSYNGKTFDIPRINAAFLERDFLPPSPYHHIDLYQVIRSTFKFQSGKLDHIVRVLDLGGKAATGGFQTWIGCMEGDGASQRRMEKYNKEDVRITERLYHELKPWIKSHPNLNLYTGAIGHVCPRCGSHDVQKRGVQRTAVTAYQRYQCNDCGGYSRSGKKLAASDLRPI